MIEVEKKIKCVADLFYTLKNMHRKRNKSYGSDFVYVSSGIRKDFLTSKSQGQITLSANVYDVVFESVGGGVWKCYVNYEEL